MLDTILSLLDGQRDQVIRLQRDLVAIPALGPDNGGIGEHAKADFVRSLLPELGIERIVAMDAPDPRVPAGTRPNLAGILPGKDISRTLWIIGHLDIVPPGDLALWDSDPYVLRVEGDWLYGRGVEDNHQAMVSGLILARAIRDAGAVPPINLGLMFVADEETGSTYGLKHVVNHHADLFRPGDLFLVPDFGEPDGSMIEVAEKSMFWLRIIVTGRQCHASVPHLGVNTLTAASAFVLKLRSLYERFNGVDPLFDPDHSTFESTKKEANVENVNTVPGRDVFYLDARVLPSYSLDEVVAAIGELGNEVEAEYGVTITYETVQREQAAPPTPVESPIVSGLSRAIRKVQGIEARPLGIGGGTVAAVLRNKGYDAAVWSKLNHNAHKPNECASVANAVSDAKVMAALLFDA